MDNSILELSERGQITIPSKIRKQFQVNRFVCRVFSGNIILEPLQTKEEFLNELDVIENEYKKTGGLTISEIKKKHNL